MEEKNTNALSPQFEKIFSKLKAANQPIDDFTFFILVGLAGLAPGDYEKLSPEEEERRWNLLFSLPQAEKNDPMQGHTGA